MFVQSADASRIAGVTEHQLKEWCIRRSLITPDVQARGRGHNALFGWRALLAIRLLSAIHSKFGGTVVHWGPILNHFRHLTDDKSFPALFGQFAVFRDGIVELRGSLEKLNGDVLAIRLDEHLAAISEGLRIDKQEVQLSLLPPLLVKTS